ncbi:M60 family metallopeptidase [Pedobacter gandavensis]|uniref:M60 family metallopeptidase n=1 Tax=Pedobacter gandavensis TaxID=2679963 RepID=UPI00293023C0|nr:M60 family metallopeptidase [Pedobacter gandavensis]
MRKNLFLAMCACTLLFFGQGCKKYGYTIPDGYADDSGNVADGAIDTNMKWIDKTMYAKAKVFPGLVDPAEPRVQNEKFTLDLNFTDQTAGNLRITVAPEPQFSTGYYAAPGELIKIEVPVGIEGLRVQIGGHTDNLSGKSPLLRDPVIYNRQQLYGGVNYVRNLYGGTIYFLANKAFPVPVEFIISNACVSPDFILGKTTDAEFRAKVIASKVPWLELRSKRVIFLVPRDKVLNRLSSATVPFYPTLAISKWNEIFDLDYNAWMGLSDNAADEKDRSPQGAWRGALDIQITNGGAHSGFPFMAQNTYGWFDSFTSVKALDVTTSGGSWGSLHEFGHNCQQPSVWSWSTLGETSNNLFSFKYANRLAATNYGVLHSALPRLWPGALAWGATLLPKNFDGTDPAISSPFTRLVPFVQFFEIYGYEAMTYLYTQARHAERLNGSDIAKHNFVYEKWSDYKKIDFAPFFDAWGIALSRAVKDKVAAKYPEMTDKTWEYNPLSHTGGKTKITYPYIQTISNINSTEGSGNNLTDNKATTYWISQKTPAISASNAFPINLVLKAARFPIAIKGVTLTQQQGSANYAKDMEVLISNDDSEYSTVGTFTLPANTTKFNYNFSAVANARFVKLVIKNAVTMSTTNAFTSLSEFNIIKP